MRAAKDGPGDLIDSLFGVELVVQAGLGGFGCPEGGETDDFDLVESAGDLEEELGADL